MSRTMFVRPYLRHSFIPASPLSALALLVGAASAASGQRLVRTIDLGGSVVRYGDASSASTATASPALRFDADHLTLGAGGTFSRSATGWASQGAVQAALFTPAAGALLGELSAFAGGSAHEDGVHTGQALATVRAHLMSPQRGAWAGLGAGSTWDGVAARPVRLAELAAWSYVGAAMALASVTPTAVADSIRFTDAELAVRFDLARAELGLAAGTRVGDRLPVLGGSTRAWGSASVAVWLAPNAAIVGSAGSYPVDFTQGFPGGRFASLGVRFGSRMSHRDRDARGVSSLSALEARGTAASTPEVVTSDSMLVLRVTDAAGGRMIRVNAPQASGVEIMGDFTSWTPVQLARAGNGWWSVTMPIPAGVHEMNVRANGGPWRVPPGLMSVTDEFGGTTGQLVFP